MGRILLITDDPARSQGLAQDLSDGLSCEIHDLRAAEAPLGGATAIVTDVLDLGSASVERLRRRLAEVHQPLSKSIDDDPQLLPILLNAGMQTFKAAPSTDAGVMDYAIELRSGMPVDVSSHLPVGQQTL